MDPQEGFYCIGSIVKMEQEVLQHFNLVEGCLRMIGEYKKKHNMEAYYGWIALNYKFGRLGNMPRKSNYGILGLGGSSLEVTFKPRDVPHGDFSMNLSVGATNHHLYDASHTGFGLNDTFEKSVAVLLRSQNAIKRGKEASNWLIDVQHPCLQTNEDSCVEINDVSKERAALAIQLVTCELTQSSRVKGDLAQNRHTGLSKSATSRIVCSSLTISLTQIQQSFVL